jgi:RNA polymerase sigma factor (sigma-70 family)
MPEGLALADSEASSTGPARTAGEPCRDAQWCVAESGDPTDLVHRFRRGDSTAFEEVVAQFQPRLAMLAYRLLGWRSRSEVEDVVQEVFLSALTHCHRFRGGASLATWLTTITVNKCRTHQRRQWIRRRLFGTRRGEHECEPDAPAAVTPDRLAAEETSQKVRWAVRALPMKDREVVVLRYFENLSADEIGSLTGVSRGAVEVRLHRARSWLAESLGPLAEERP